MAELDLDPIVRDYRANGYVIVPGLLSPEEVSALRAVTQRIEDAAAGLSEETPVYDFVTSPEGEVTIERIKKPHRADPFYWSLAGHPGIIAVLSALIGPDIRLSHSKINMKAARGGSALEWHQDWAFAPHTHMGTCVASVMIDEARPENGAMQVLAGSHKGPLLEHHGEDGYFIGAVDVADPGVDLGQSRSLVGPAGTVAFHHPLTIHGSGVNRSGDPRRILFLEYAAADAYPLFYAVDWEEYEGRMVAGSSAPSIRVEANPVKLPQPSRAGSSIYKIQAGLKSRYFAKAG
ncbi:phytanoyl-CoA dioxygenase family protein [Flavisphingomonas formosensis]|uniref:phytanoyl-CoA dioxygenase family protein n=1 Tax=Flavisphingomonas formosensis TaxID=861534 RepID=UPI0012F779C1|nr:phytanoyl-CoA dioxygenase family protein [Sphingomonas formosensis]